MDKMIFSLSNVKFSFTTEGIILGKNTKQSKETS